MQKTKTSSNINGKKKPEGVITWTAREPNSGRRWWAFLLVAYFTPPLSVLLFALGNWSAGLVLAAFSVTFFVVYLPRPKIWKYCLIGHVLTATREHRRGPADEMNIDLRDYHSLDVHPIRPRRHENQSTLVLTLWPRKRFASDIDVYVARSAVTVHAALRARVSSGLERPA